jgi:hypothetical protein
MLSGNIGVSPCDRPAIRVGVVIISGHHLALYSAEVTL